MELVVGTIQPDAKSNLVAATFGGGALEESESLSGSEGRLLCLQPQLLFPTSALHLTPPLSGRQTSRWRAQPWRVRTRDLIYGARDISADERLGRRR